MKIYLLRALIVVALFVLAPAGLALAHGGATIVVDGGMDTISWIPKPA